MQSVLMTIATRQDLENCLADPRLHDPALDHLQALIDEEWGYDSSGSWVLVGGGGFSVLDALWSVKRQERRSLFLRAR